MNKNGLLVIFNLIVIVLMVVCPVWGLKISNDFKIYSYKELKQQKEAYQVVLNDYNKLVDTNYNSALSNLNKEKEAYEQAKQRFEQIKSVNSYDELVRLSIGRQYNLEFVWVKLDLLARNNNLGANFKLNKSTETTYYDIAVTLTGDYLSIKNYIYDILIDMDLQFKSEDITIVPQGDGLVATFVIKNIDIIM